MVASSDGPRSPWVSLSLSYLSIPPLLLAPWGGCDCSAGLRLLFEGVVQYHHAYLRNQPLRQMDSN